MVEENASSPATGSLAEIVRRAIRAHPVLRDQKKLEVKGLVGRVRVEGVVFTRDMLRQLRELVARLPGGEHVRVDAKAEVKAPRLREAHGRVPDVSPGPLNMDPGYSTRHLRGES